jgi:tetratricopeptide (TPR) repeat protein
MKRLLCIAFLICGTTGLLDASTAGTVRAGNRAYKKGVYDQALDKYRAAEIAAPANPVVHFNIGDALYKTGKPDEAAAAYQRALAGKDARRRAQTYYNLGNTAYRANKSDEALEYYKKALDHDPGDRDAKYNFEYILRQKAQPQSKNKQQRDQKGQNNKKDKDQQQAGNKEGQQQNAQQQSGQDGNKGMSKEDAQRILQVYDDQDRTAAKRRKMAPPKLPKVDEDW